MHPVFSDAVLQHPVCFALPVFPKLDRLTVGLFVFLSYSVEVFMQSSATWSVTGLDSVANKMH